MAGASLFLVSLVVHAHAYRPANAAEPGRRGDLTVLAELVHRLDPVKLALGAAAGVLLLGVMGSISHGVDYMRVFDVNKEQNYASVFSGLTLWAAALMAVFNGLVRQESLRARRWWLALAFVFVYLGLDEMTALHEEFQHVTGSGDRPSCCPSSWSALAAWFITIQEMRSNQIAVLLWSRVRRRGSSRRASTWSSTTRCRGRSFLRSSARWSARCCSRSPCSSRCGHWWPTVFPPRSAWPRARRRRASCSPLGERDTARAVCARGTMGSRMTRRGLLLVLVVAAVVGFAVAAAARWAGDDDSSNPASRQSTDSPVSDARVSRVWAVGDGADGGNASMRVAELIERGAPRPRALPGRRVRAMVPPTEFERNYRPAYSRFDKITFPTPGNHDWPNHDAGYDPYWEKANPQVPTNRHYYRFKAGGWEFFSLNSESGLEAGSPQMKWLKAQLRGKRGNCRIAFWHRPFLNAGRHGDQEDTGALWRAVKGRAAIVLNGHDHNFQHFKPRDGIVELVSGAGGDGRYSSDQNDPRLVWDEDDEFGALRLDLRPGLARFRFVAVDQGTIHSGRVRCNRSWQATA